MADLTTTYLGLPLQHPVVASASPLSHTAAGIRSLEDAGASAVVLFSLFEEQIDQENAALQHLGSQGADSSPEAQGYFPNLGSIEDFEVGPEAYLELIREAKASVDIPVIASLNGTTAGGWTRYATLMESAGADAIELNLFRVATDPQTNGAQVEAQHVAVVAAVRAAVSIPVAVKLGPHFSAFGDVARRFVAAGANGLVLFNRFYQPDFDLDRMEVAPTLELSTPGEIRLPLLWIALLHGRILASLAATTGVETSAEVVKYILAGADVTMTTSALLRHGVGHLQTLVTGLDHWLDSHQVPSVSTLRGSMSHANVAEPERFERANYIRILRGWRNPYVR